MELEHRFNLICNIFFFLRSLKEEIRASRTNISYFTTHNNKFPIILAIIFERVDFLGSRLFRIFHLQGKIEIFTRQFRRINYYWQQFDTIIRITYWKMLILCTFLLLANSMLLRFSNCKMAKMHAGCWPEFEFV